MAAPPRDPTPERRAGPPGPPSYDQLACSALVRNGGAEFDSERPSTEDRIPKLFELVAEANRCWEAKLISSAELSRLLQIARRRLVEWYELDARSASAILVGDTTLDYVQPRRGHQSWAALYLALLERLAMLEGSSRLESTGLTERMLRVEAQAMRVLDKLQQCDGHDRHDPLVQDVEAAVVELRSRLEEEAGAWTAQTADHHLPAQAELTMPRSVPPRSWTPQDRISRVATLVYWIASQWGMHSIPLYRGTLGVGLQAYLEAFRRAEALAPLGERLRVAWPMYVHTPSIAERGTDKRVDEVLQDLVYDALNGPGYFAMRDAQSAWLVLLAQALATPGGQGATADERWKQAAHALVHAWDVTTSRDVRLRNIAALINQADLVFVQSVKTQGEPTPEGDPRIALGAPLAELGLCLMNQSFFEGAQSPCPPVPSPSAVRPQPGQQPWCPEEPEVAAAFIERAPPEVLEAYRRVLGALVVAGEPLTERTQCGVLALLRRKPLASLRADATLLEAGMDLVEARRVRLGPQRMGEFLAAALPRLRMDVTAPCVRLGLGSNCSLPEVLAVVSRPPVPDPNGWLALWRRNFCSGVKAGARVIAVADGLLAQGSGNYGGSVFPLSVHQFNRYRSDFIAASTACRAAFPGDVDRTPDGRRPDPGAESAEKPVASERGARHEHRGGGHAPRSRGSLEPTRALLHDLSG